MDIVLKTEDAILFFPDMSYEIEVQSSSLRSSKGFDHCQCILHHSM